jgi:hypothetical protein
MFARFAPARGRLMDRRRFSARPAAAADRSRDRGFKDGIAFFA